LYIYNRVERQSFNRGARVTLRSTEAEEVRDLHLVGSDGAMELLMINHRLGLGVFSVDLSFSLTLLRLAGLENLYLLKLNSGIFKNLKKKEINNQQLLITS